uniref:Uncharacterized protein n=1 Tax=Anguilla anguilla TaxID=7936 RepID=A0A0E9VS22_ANGAN
MLFVGINNAEVFGGLLSSPYCSTTGNCGPLHNEFC